MGKLQLPNPFPILILCLIVLLPTPGWAQNSSAFEKGIVHYKAGAYDQALEAFLQAEADGHVSGALYYNIGNTYFRLNQLGRAILNYERARRLIPGDELLLHSLSVAQGKSQNNIRYLPRPFWIQWWNWMVAHLRSRGMFLIGFVLYTLASGLLGYRIWMQSRNPWIRRALSLAALGSLFFLAAAFAASSQQVSNHPAVIVESKTELRDFPSEQAVTLQEIQEGMIVDIIDTESPWVRVYLPDGTTGWIIADHLEEV